VATLRPVLAALAVVAVGCSDGQLETEVGLVRYQCPERRDAIELVGDFADWIVERSLQERVSVADVHERAQVVPNTDEDRQLVEEGRSEFDEFAASRGCEPF
jgi:hypothetical protein